MRERCYRGKQQRGRGNNPQDWMLTVSNNEEKADINRERQPSANYPLVEGKSRSSQPPSVLLNPCPPVTEEHLAERRPRRQPSGDVQVKAGIILNMEKAGKANEEPQSAPKADEVQPPVEHSPGKQSSEEPSEEEQSSEDEFFPEELLPELLPEMLVSEERPPQEPLSRRNLFEERPPMEQPPCGVGKHKLEEGSFKERLARSRPQFRGDIHGRNLSNEEMIKVAEEMEEMKRVRNKLMIMHWKARRNRPYPI
ncbi:transcription elongation factor A protein-like 1 isoform X1 [Manis javanica]|uniref:transcription elongation factor A protein-like 1 isoform X1 n=1 Tax=Manis javanica TaxID=9974 RepID=UPI0018795B99|nr:transcription elongation factor A protein-like 1 isoform X1 [Manis javanica]